MASLLGINSKLNKKWTPARYGRGFLSETYAKIGPFIRLK